jgi:ABC-type amino acid transport substrate-binding protein
MLRKVRCTALAAALVTASLVSPRTAAAAAAACATTDLRVCLYAGFAPFSSLVNGVWQGWDVTFLQQFARAQHRNFCVVQQPTFDGIWLRPSEGKCDIAGSGISNTKKRREQTHEKGWSTTYYHVVRAYLVRTVDFVGLQRVRDLAGKKIIVTKGSTADADIVNRLHLAGIGNVTIDYTTDEKAAALEVKKGEAFAYGGGYGSVQLQACDVGDGQLAVVWPHCNMMPDGQQVTEPFSFVVSPDNSTLLQALDQYIEASKKNPQTAYPGTLPPDLPCKPAP